MNPQGSVDAKIGVVGGCGCPNVVADDVMYPLGSIQGSCADLGGYTSVYDPLTNVQPVVQPTMGASVLEMDENILQNDNMPNKVPFGAYPGAETGGIGEPLPLEDFQFQYGPYPDSTTVNGASVMETISGGWNSLQDGVKGLFGMKSEDSWTAEMRKKWQEGRAPAATGAAATSDETAFQTWLNEIKKRYADYQAQRGGAPKRAVLGAEVSAAGAFSTLIWVGVFVALAGLIYWKREAIRKMLPFGKKKEVAAPLAPLPMQEAEEVLGAAMHRYRPKYRRFR